MDHAVKLTINGETREFPMGITYKEVVKEYEKKNAPIPGPKGLFPLSNTLYRKVEAVFSFQ